MLSPRNATDFIVVHCSATPGERDIGAVELDKMHRDRGFIRIGYHLVIRRNGIVEIGRNLNDVGAHVADHNHNSVGICLIGGVSADDVTLAVADYTDAQYMTLETVLRFLRLVYPDALIQGHRDFTNVHKACPCFDVRHWVQTRGIGNA